MMRRRSNQSKLSNGDQNGSEIVSEDAIPSRRVHSLHRNKNKSQDIQEAFEMRPRLDDAEDAQKYLNEHADKILKKMGEDPDLMDNNIVSEKLREQALKNMPQSLTVKRLIKSKLTKSLDQSSKGKPISWYKTVKYKMGMKAKKFNSNLKNIINFELWYSSLKRIEGSYGSGIASYFRYLRWLFIVNLAVTFITMAFIIIPQVSHSKRLNYATKFHLTDLFSGEGYLNDSMLYYGFYSNSSVTFVFFRYHLPYSYFYCFLLAYVVSILVLGLSVALSYRKSFIETEGGLKNVYAYKIFCGWDYNVATEKAAKLKSSAIYHELKELLNEDESRYNVTDWVLSAWKFLIRFVCHSIIVIILISTGYLIWFLLEKHRHKLINPILVSVIITLVNDALPILFSIIIKQENYKKPRVRLNILLLRRSLLSFIIVGVLGIYWLINSFTEECWETHLGQEIYRLVIFDTIFCTISALIYIPWFFINKHIRQIEGTTEFDIAGSTLELIYGQLLLWMGLFFAPLLAPIIVIKQFCTWYIKEKIVLKLSRPVSQSWRSAQTRTWFLALTFLGQLLAAGILLFILLRIPPSQCGPFQSYEYFYEVLFMGVDEHKSYVLKSITYLTRPGVVGLIMLALCVRAYYMRAKANAQRDMVRILRNMLSWESRDKEFLLQYISNVTNGEFRYRHWNERGRDPYLAVPKVASRRNTEDGDAKYDSVEEGV